MLVGTSMTIGVIWLVVLPWICTHPNVAQHIETQKRLGINPSVKFYSELDVAPAVSLRAERLNQTYSAEFWGASQVGQPVQGR